MNYEYIEIILYLAEKTSLYSKIRTSTNKISKDLKISQQTISRKLKEMEKKELIKREVSYDGHKIELTKKTIEELKNHSKRLKNILKPKKASISGFVSDGLGEGKYYLSIKQYKERIKKNLGFIPFPGTLNIKVKKEEINPFLNRLDSKEIKGFKTIERTFGSLKCYPIKIKETSSAIIIPERTRYEDVLEIISKHNLRKKLKLKTKDKITIKN